jgi:tRNA (guanine37-N1)-methyltransferase
MRIDILTLFPEMFKGPFDESILQRAQSNGLVEIKIHNLRKWAVDKRGTVDDRPYGGGTGMILMIEPIYRALNELKTKNSKLKTKVILLDPRGKVFNQKIAQKLSKEKHLIFICGHYEGVDERVKEHLVDEVISIGDYILTGGELPAMVITDAIVRLLPGVLEKPEATKFESFSDLKIGKLKIGNLLEYPQYTRPENFLGWKVPKILLSGNHQKIAEWRRKKAEELTKKLRPDLI